MVEVTSESYTATYFVIESERGYRSKIKAGWSHSLSQAQKWITERAARQELDWLTGGMSRYFARPVESAEILLVTAVFTVDEQTPAARVVPVST